MDDPFIHRIDTGKKMMRKSVFLVCFLILFFGSSTLVKADMGPKPQLKITIVSPPNEPYYVDLLVKADYVGDFKIDLEGFDPLMIAKLKSLEADGWYPALVNGTRAPLSGDLIGTAVDGKMIHSFTYRLPDDYRIILVTQSGRIVVSDPMVMDSFYTGLSFNALDGSIKKPNVIYLYLLQFTTTLIPTLMVEFIVLLMFGLTSKRNLVVFLIMNLVTQIFLTLSVNAALITMGLLSAIVALVFVEGFIWIFEMIICWKYFDKQKKAGRRIAYALIANMVSFILGFILILVQSTWI